MLVPSGTESLFFMEASIGCAPLTAESRRGCIAGNRSKYPAREYVARPRKAEGVSPTITENQLAAATLALVALRGRG